MGWLCADWSGGGEEGAPGKLAPSPTKAAAAPAHVRGYWLHGKTPSEPREGNTDPPSSVPQIVRIIEILQWQLILHLTTLAVISYKKTPNLQQHHLGPFHQGNVGISGSKDGLQGYKGV
ncbi:uncharacterized protein PHA67_011291 isoform 2-T2 [Liasis olivaceus]